jgi:glutamine amidotransferase
MIAIIDYKGGNLSSVENALKRLGAEYEVTASTEAIQKASHVILPGVGEASNAMRSLQPLAGLLKGLTQPVLGICIGLQLMCAHSEEGDTECMNIFDSRVLRFKPSEGVKIPHMGWNTITGLKGPLFSGIEEGSYVYYVHSYYPEYSEAECIAKTEYAGVTFSAALCKGNFFGTQFHPEKSGPVGEKILENFLRIC